MKTGPFRSAVAAIVLGFGLAAAAQADQLADFKAKGKVVVATEMHFAPFDLLVDGEFQGIDRELIDGVAKNLGVQVEYLDLPWDSILPGLEANKFDFVIAPVTITAERAKRYAFTLPIGDATVALAKKAGDTSITKPTDIAGKVAASQKGSAQLEQLKTFSGTSVVFTTNLSFGEWATVFGDAKIITALIDRRAHRCARHCPRTNGGQWLALETGNDSFRFKASSAAATRKKNEITHAMTPA